MQDAMSMAVRAVHSARYLSILTGAGISVESGIPPFRGPGSIWDKIDPMEFAHIRSFLKNPAKVWDVLLREMKHVLDSATPNPAHLILAQLERRLCPNTIITQNIDGLHQAAGSSDVIEFHGNFAWVRCQECDHSASMKSVSLASLPPRCEKCGGLLRPDCVFFGESIPRDALIRAEEAAVQSDVMLVIGTSATVQPAASMPSIAKKAGATIIEINPMPSLLTDHVSDIFLKGPAAKTLTLLMDALGDRQDPKGG